MGVNRVKKLNEIVSFIREKKRVPATIVAIKFGYSYKYFKYSVLKELMTLFNDIKIEKQGEIEYIVAGD